MSELRLVFLGTSAGRPTPRRSVASVFLQFGPDCFLFDCGEGTQLQALRAGVRTSRLKAICISHFHGDHINGLPGFLGTVGLNGHREKVVIASPRGLDRYLAVLKELNILHPSFELELVQNAAGEVYATPDYSITSVKVEHRVPTYGFIFRERDLVGRFDLERAKELGVPVGPLFGRLQRGESVTLDDGRVVQPADVLGASRRGRSVAYITDTRPSPRVVEAVQGVDVLIHAATYLPEHRDQAIDRKHSTVREAAMVAREAGVGRLMLTHISPKHTSSREILNEARAVFAESHLAEDFTEHVMPVPD
jgi:ribonuclease Z